MMYCSMGHDFRSTDDANGAGACNAPQVIALDIDDHRQLRVFFGILVEFADQKPILIGRAGQTMKRIASEARQDMQAMFGGPVFLEVFVKVRSGWAADEQVLASLGYE